MCMCVYLCVCVYICACACISACRCIVCVLCYMCVFVQDGEVGKKVCAYLATPLEAEQVYAQLYRKHTSPPQTLVKADYIASQIGSNRLKKVFPCVFSGRSR